MMASFEQTNIMGARGALAALNVQVLEVMLETHLAQNIVLAFGIHSSSKLADFFGAVWEAMCVETARTERTCTSSFVEMPAGDRSQVVDVSLDQVLLALWIHNHAVRRHHKVGLDTANWALTHSLLGLVCIASPVAHTRQAKWVRATREKTKALALLDHVVVTDTTLEIRRVRQLLLHKRELIHRNWTCLECVRVETRVAVSTQSLQEVCACSWSSWLLIRGSIQIFDDVLARDFGITWLSFQMRVVCSQVKVSWRAIVVQFLFFRDELAHLFHLLVRAAVNTLVRRRSRLALLRLWLQHVHLDGRLWRCSRLYQWGSLRTSVVNMQIRTRVTSGTTTIVVELASLVEGSRRDLALTSRCGRQKLGVGLEHMGELAFASRLARVLQKELAWERAHSELLAFGVVELAGVAVAALSLGVERARWRAGACHLRSGGGGGQFLPVRHYWWRPETEAGPRIGGKFSESSGIFILPNQRTELERY